MGGYVGQMGSRIRVELNTLSEPQDRTHSSRATLCQERTLLSPPSPRAASFSKLMLRDTRILQKMDCQHFRCNQPCQKEKRVHRYWGHTFSNFASPSRTAL